MKPYSAWPPALMECTGPTERKEVGGLPGAGRCGPARGMVPGSPAEHLRGQPKPKSGSAFISRLTQTLSLTGCRCRIHTRDRRHLLGFTDLFNMEVATKRGFYKAGRQCTHTPQFCQTVSYYRSSKPTHRPFALWSGLRDPENCFSRPPVGPSSDSPSADQRKTVPSLQAAVLISTAPKMGPFTPCTRPWPAASAQRFQICPDSETYRHMWAGTCTQRSIPRSLGSLFQAPHVPAQPGNVPSSFPFPHQHMSCYS